MFCSDFGNRDAKLAPRARVSRQARTCVDKPSDQLVYDTTSRGDNAMSQQRARVGQLGRRGGGQLSGFAIGSGARQYMRSGLDQPRHNAHVPHNISDGHYLPPQPVN